MVRRATGFLADFQKFLMRGNVVDLAVAVIIGGAFGKIITSLVEDIITPAILSPVLMQLKLNDLQQLSLNGIKYGVFLAAIINFIVIAFCLFLLIRAFEQAKKRFERQEVLEAEVTPPDPAIAAQDRTATALDRLARALEARNL